MKRFLYLSFFVLASLVCHAETFRNPRFLPLGIDPVSVVAGDINGDGRPDILYGTGQYTTGVLHPLIAQVDGTYIPGVDIVLPAAISTRCRLVDLTEDRKLDLVCAGFSAATSSVAVLPGNGDGTFQPAVLTSLPASFNFASLTISAIGDVNNDGHLDVLVADGENSNVFVLLGDGTGHLTLKSTVTGGCGSVISTLQHLKGDANLDLVISGVDGCVVSYFGHGDGTFTQSQIFYYFTSSVLADADGDGHSDLFSGPAGNFQILHGNADGTFNTTPIVSIDYTSGNNQKSGYGSYLSTYAYIDLNGDGIPDAVSRGDDGLTVMMGRPGLTFAPPVHYPVAQNFFDGMFTGANTSDLVDLNGDGHPDFIAAGPNGVYISYGLPDGTFETGSVYESGAVVDFATVADFNNDGTPDVVTSGDTQLHLRAGVGDGTFGTVSTLPTTGTVDFSDLATRDGATLVAGDFNGDGKKDILALGSPSTYVYHLYLFNGHGDGTFDTPVETSIDVAPNFISPFSLVDINKDGRDDLALVDRITPTLTIYLSQGNGMFKSVPTQLPHDANGDVSFPVFADLTHTGHVDAIYSTDQHVYILPGNGDGTFGAATTLNIPTVAGAYNQAFGPVAIGDFDGDGLPDIALLVPWFRNQDDQIEHPTQIFIYYGQPGGGFSAPVAGTVSYHSFTRLQSADLDGDGISDLISDNDGDLYALNGPVIGIVHGRANRTLSAESNYVAGTGISSLFVVDLNHDRMPDLLAANGDLNATANSFTVLLNDGNSPAVQGTLVAAPEPSVSGQPFTLTATLTPPSGIATPNLSGTVSFFIDGAAEGSAPLVNDVATVNITSTLAIGTHQLTATWPGQISGAITLPPVSLSGTHVVTGRPVTLTIAANPMSPNVGQSVAFTVSLADSGISPSVPPTGTIQILNGSAQIDSFPVAGDATFTFNYAPTAAGSDTISAVYSGDTAHSSATADVVLDVQLLQPAITVTSFPNPSVYGQPITYMVAVSGGASGLIPSGNAVLTGPFGATIRIALDASGKGSYLSPPPGNSYAIPEPAGTLPLIPTYLGDNNFAAITGTTYIQTILPAPSTTTLTASPTQVYQLQTVTLTAAVVGLVSPTIDPITGLLIPPVNFYATGTVQFFDGATLIGSNALTNGQATLPVSTLSVGTHIITARFIANSNLGGSTSSAVTVTVLPSDFSIDITPLSLSLQTGRHTNLTATLTSIGAFSDDMKFSVGSLPQYATVNVTPVQIHLGAAGKATASIYIDTDALIGFLSQKNTQDSVVPPPGRIVIAFLFSPFVLFLFRRKRRVPRIAAAFVVLALLLGVSGCGDNKYPASTPPGSYTVHVTALGSQTGVSHSADIALTITR